MKTLLSIELYKLRTTPAAWVSLAITLGLGAASVASNALVPNPDGPLFGSTDHVNHALSVSALTSMVMLAIGVVLWGVTVVINRRAGTATPTLDPEHLAGGGPVG